MTSSLISRLILFLFAVIGGLIALDINKHGSFQASVTGKFLKESGALHYGDIAWSNFRTFSQQGYRWCQKNGPVYITKIREGAGPYIQTALTWLAAVGELLWTNVKLLCDYFLEKKPFIEQWINNYAPGVMDAVGSWFSQALRLVMDYTVLIITLLLKYLSVAGQWLMENVFIGSLSPENLQRFTQDALNTTQQLARQTFYWLNEKFITHVSSAS